MTEPLRQVEDLQLRDYLRPLVSRWWIILGIVVTVTVGTYLYYDRQPDVYSATTSIFVDASQANAGSSESIAPVTDRTTQNQATLLTTRDVASRVAKQLGVDPGSVGGVSAAPSAGSDFVTIKAVNNSPAMAARLANAYAKAFIDIRSEEQRAALQKALTEQQRQLDRISNTPANLAERSTALASVRRLQLALSIPGGEAQQLDPATPPTTPDAPNPKRNALFAFVLALLAGVGLAFGLERFDRRLKRVDDVAPAYGLPLMVVLPHSSTVAASADGSSALSGDFREAFRQLRTNLQLEGLNRPIKRILVTSAVPGEGKSTVVRNLAIAFCEFGQRVAVVDCDLRRPTMAALFGMDNQSGLTSVMTNEVTLAEATQAAPVQAKGLATLARMRGAESAVGTGPYAEPAPGPVSDVATIDLLSAGPSPANPQAVLSTDRMASILDEIADEHDIVLVDSPPVTVVSDALALAGQVDAVLIVARLEVTTKDGAKRAVDLLRRVPDANPIGVVANDITGNEAAKYSYGYENLGPQKR